MFTSVTLSPCGDTWVIHFIYLPSALTIKRNLTELLVCTQNGIFSVYRQERKRSQKTKIFNVFTFYFNNVILQRKMIFVSRSLIEETQAEVNSISIRKTATIYLRKVSQIIYIEMCSPHVSFKAQRDLIAFSLCFLYSITLDQCNYKGSL